MILDSQNELIKHELLANRKEFNNGFSSPFTVKEKNTTLSSHDLLEVSQNISLYFSPKKTSQQSKLTLISVDPQHLYIYWSLDGQSSNTLANALLHDEVILRIYSISQSKEGLKKNLSAEVTVHDFQSQTVISLPYSEHIIDYSACIGRIAESQKFSALLKSNIISVQDKPVIHSIVNKLIKNNDDGEESLVPAKHYYINRNHSGIGIKKSS